MRKKPCAIFNKEATGMKSAWINELQITEMMLERIQSFKFNQLEDKVMK